MTRAALFEIAFRWWPVAVALLMYVTAGCFSVEPVQVDGATLNCFWDGRLAFTGAISIEGEGVIAPEDLKGSWELTKKGEDLDCVVDL